MDDDDRIRGASDGTKMTAAGARTNGNGTRASNGGARVAVKREAAAGATASPSPAPTGAKDDSAPPSLSPDDVKPSPDSESISTPDASTAVATAPKLSRKGSSVLKTTGSGSATPSGGVTTARTLFDHVPDATVEATSQFQVITECLYGSKHMGSSDNDAFDCDCAEEWRDGLNLACGEDSDCINRATKMECVEDECNCGTGCQNQRFQRRQYARVSVIKTEKKGFGLRSDADLRPNDFIFEYLGEVINEPTFRRRMLQYDDEGIKHFYFMSLTKSEFVDATRKGNLGRFCNHSCSPNCYVDKWVVGNKLRMGIFAGRYIRAGEELVFDYNVDRYGADPQPCYCGEPNCTGFIGGKTQTERATKLSQATIEALGIDDVDSWDTTVSKKQRRKKPNEDDEEYISSLQQTGLAEDGVTKVMAALMQCKEKWIAVKLLTRIQSARDDERVLNRVVRMHGYQILCSILTLFYGDDNVVLQVLDILYRFPRLTKNKISDSNIEAAIETLTSSEHEDVAAESKRLLEEWSKLETAYRIPRKKFDPNAPATAFEDRRGRDVSNNESDNASNSPRQRAPISPLHGMNVPKGPRSNIPQRNSNYFNGNNVAARSQRKLKGNAGALPPGWFSATDPKGNVYYYTKSGATTWTQPTQPADKAGVPLKAPSKAQQDMNAVQEIINSLTKEAPRPSASHTPQASTTPIAEPNKERWRSLPIEKQKRIYENTSVTDRFQNRLPKDEIKKFGRELGKKLVASDYKNNRVDNPNQISAKQERKVKAYVRDFFERAASKYQEHEKKKAEREAAHVAPAHARAEDTDMSDVATGPQKRGTEAGVEDARKKDDDLAGLDDMALSDDEDAHSHQPGPSLSPSEPSDRKRKWADGNGVPSPGGAMTPSETPSLKRLKDSDTATSAPPTPPPPPPPPPADEDEDEDLTRHHHKEAAALRQREEEEEALRRENEEAMRDFEAQSKSGLPVLPHPTTALNGAKEP